MARVREALSPVVVDERLTLPVRASIGHVLGGREDSWEELIDRADLDMYRVKHLVRGDVHPFETRPEVPSQR